jgi:hypothetical protein
MLWSQEFDQAQYNILERSRVEFEYDVLYKVGSTPVPIELCAGTFNSLRLVL